MRCGFALLGMLTMAFASADVKEVQEIVKDFPTPTGLDRLVELTDSKDGATRLAALSWIGYFVIFSEVWRDDKNVRWKDTCFHVMAGTDGAAKRAILLSFSSWKPGIPAPKPRSMAILDCGNSPEIMFQYDNDGFLSELKARVGGWREVATLLREAPFRDFYFLAAQFDALPNVVATEALRRLKTKNIAEADLCREILLRVAPFTTPKSILEPYFEFKNSNEWECTVRRFGSTIDKLYPNWKDRPLGLRLIYGTESGDVIESAFFDHDPMVVASALKVYKPNPAQVRRQFATLAKSDLSFPIEGLKEVPLHEVYAAVPHMRGVFAFMMVGLWSQDPSANVVFDRLLPAIERSNATLRMTTLNEKIRARAIERFFASRNAYLRASAAQEVLRPYEAKTKAGEQILATYFDRILNDPSRLVRATLGRVMNGLDMARYNQVRSQLLLDGTPLPPPSEGSPGEGPGEHILIGG